MKFVLYHHKERKWASYIERYTDVGTWVERGLASVQVQSLPQQNAHLAFAKLPASMRNLLFFAKPDLVICLDDDVRPLRPIFALDVTTHVPARDHWIQRFPNLVGCAQVGIPGAFIAPGAMPDRENFQGRVDPLFFFVYDRVVEIHQTPIFIAQWEARDGKTLSRDSAFGDLPDHNDPDVALTLQFVNLVIDAAVHGRPFSTLMGERLVVDLRNRIRSVGYSKLPLISDFKRLKVNMPGDSYMSFAELAAWFAERNLALPEDLPERITKRERNLVFAPLAASVRTPAMREALLSRIARRGGDPYTEQPLVFDYLFCRTGVSPADRDANLVIDLRVLEFADFASYVKSTWSQSPLQYEEFAQIEDKIPIYTLHLREGLGQVMKNFVRLYAFSADILVFSDGVLYF